MSSTLDVLIVGAGPVGLVMACELARRGHNLRIIEQKAQRDPWSKAAAIQPRTLEIFEDMGIIERFLDSGQKMTGVNLYKGSERLAHLDLHIQQTRYPFLLGKSQRSTEELLEARLAELGVAIERSIALLHFDQDDQQVRAILQGPDGQQDTVCAHYLIGCDGSRSRTREELGLDFEGSTFEAGLIQADVRVDFPFPTQPGEAYSFFSDQGPMGCLPLLEDHYRVIALQSEGQDGEVDFEHFQQVCAQRAPEGFAVHDPDWVVGFRFHGRLASRYRVGRVFLAGDAAHIHSPVGGQGMNLGIQDAYNLAWKLHMVLQAQAPQSLLDTYEAERRRIADTVVRSTDRASKSALRMLGNRNPLITGFRDQIVKLLFRTGFVDDLIFSAISGVDIAYPDSPLSAEHHISPLSAQIPRSGSDERPDTGDWLLFRRTLEAGARVPDCDLPTDTPLFTLRRGREHLLLAFDGRATTQSGYQTLRQLHQIAAQYPWITTRLIVLADQLPEPLHDLQDLTLLDPQGELHQHFGAMSEALYLLRPDGYVAFRSQPAEPSMLQDYLQEHYLT